MRIFWVKYVRDPPLDIARAIFNRVVKMNNKREKDCAVPGTLKS